MIDSSEKFKIAKIAAFSGKSAPVFDQGGKEFGSISITDETISFTDGYAINFSWPSDKIFLVENFFESTGASFGNFS